MVGVKVIRIKNVMTIDKNDILLPILINTLNR